MPLGRLTGLVASMPSWIPLILDQDSLELNPPPGQGQYRQPTTDQLVAALDANVKKARESLTQRDDQYLTTTKWRLTVGGKTVSEDLRHIVLRDTIEYQLTDKGRALQGVLHALDAWADRWMLRPEDEEMKPGSKTVDDQRKAEPQGQALRARGRRRPR